MTQKRINLRAAAVLCISIGLNSLLAVMTALGDAALAQGGVSSPASAPASESQTTSTSTVTTTTSKPKRQSFRRMKAKKAKTIRRKRRRGASINGGKLQGGVSRHHKPLRRKSPPGKISSGQAKRLNKLNAFLKNPPPSNRKLPEIGEPGTSVPLTSP